MTDPTLEVLQQRFFSMAARLADRQRISRTEELWLRDYLDRQQPLRPEEPGFAEAPSGDAGAPNNLRRTNWFNGRYLTAEALSRQDVYFDHRARLDAQALMPGIAWGLGIEGVGLNRLSGRVRRGGLATTAPLTLRRGLAFDGIGRPILVSQTFSFTLADLIGEAVKTPRRVVGGRREFQPCLCLVPDPGGPTGGSAALPSGPYLLVIEAGELPEGRAKVTGDLCGGRRNAPCEADAWRGSFGLSLVRLPVDAPLLSEIPDVWALRGTLSAYYFDVFEHALWQRWDPAFPVDGGFRRDSEPGRHEGMAIPLALVHLGEDGTALYLDAWIPRRLITATPGEDWHRTRFGAPPRAAAWARIHQFQTMLQESLALRSMAGTPAAEANLHGRGFRHIPPIGFLPLQPRPLRPESNQGTQTLTACTEFERMSPTATAPNPFAGNGATFQLENSDRTNNQILQRGGATGLILREGERCRITPAQPAEQVTLRLQVNIDGNAAGGTGTAVEARGPVDAAGQPQVLGGEVVQQPNQLTTITLRATGIRQVIVTAKYETVLSEFCYEYLAATPPVPAAPTRSALVREALRQGEAYFAGTNVVVYGVAALHDDDILEDLHNVIDKDPLQLELRGLRDQQDGNPLRNWPIPNATSSDAIAAFGEAGLLLSGRQGQGVFSFLLLLGVALRNRGLEIDALVNRRTEVVKLVVPLQGLSRRHPLLGAIPEDAVRQSLGWGLTGPADLATSTLAGLLRERGLDVLPRGHVVYVKQRLVLLDLVIQVVEILQKVVELILAATTMVPSNNNAFDRRFIGRSNPRMALLSLSSASTGNYVEALNSLSEDDRQLIRTAITQPAVQDLLQQSMVSAAPALARGDRSQRFLAQVASAIEAQPASITDPQERQSRALGQVADAWAADFPEAQVLQLLAAIQPPEQTLDLVKRLGAAPGPVAGPTVVDALDLQPPTSFGGSTGRVLFAEVRQRLDERPIRDLGVDLPDNALVASLTVGDVLARSPEDAAKVLGGDDRLDAVKRAFLSDRQAALDAATALADGVQPDVVARVETAVAGGEKPEEVFTQLRREEEAKPEPERNNQLLRNLGDAETLLRVSGNRIEALGALRRRPGG